METINMTIEEKKNFYGNLIYTSHAKVAKAIGIKELVPINATAKQKHTLDNKGVLEFLLYLTPYKLDNRIMCPNAEHCKVTCLAGSGINVLYKYNSESPIDRVRRIRTELFLYNRDVFMQMYLYELDRAFEKANKLGLRFLARLNGTSDLSPLMFKYNGKNILELRPNITFNEYTKVRAYLDLQKKYNNIDYTFSYNGYNDSEAKYAIENGTRVAVVFDLKKNDILPKKFNGYEVINGDISDVRADDPKNVIVLLHYKPSKKTIVDGHYAKQTDNPFVISKNDSRIEW